MTVRLVGASLGEYVTGFNTASDYFDLAQYTAIITGVCTEIHVYSHANGNVKVAIYANNAGEPGILITANDIGQAVLADQWNTLTIGNTNITKDVIYWLAMNQDTLNAVTRNSSAGQWRYKAATYSGFTFPSPAGTGFTSATTRTLCIAGWGTSGKKSWEFRRMSLVGSRTAFFPDLKMD